LNIVTTIFRLNPQIAMVTSGETGNRMLPTLVTQLDKDPWLY